MTVTTVAERIVKPGRAVDYILRAREVFERLRQPGRASRLLVAVSDDDPDHLVSLGEWENLQGAGEAYYRVPKELVDAVESLVVAKPAGTYRAYHRLRSVERVLERGRYLAAIRLRVAPDDAGAFEAWARGLFDDGLVSSRVVAVRLLAAEGAPGEYLATAERSDEGSGRLAEFLAANPPPVPLLEQARFLGRIDGHWELPTPVPTATQPLTRVP